MTPETPALKGAERIAAYLKTLPDQPGVYRMLNAAGDGLFVGKTQELKKRAKAQEAGQRTCQGQRPCRPAHSHGGGDGGDAVRHHRIRDRSAAAGIQSDQ